MKRETTAKIKEHASEALEVQNTDTITKKIKFNKETLRNLVTMASREFFDTKLKSDEQISQMLDTIINEHYAHYWNANTGS